jgi:hypothetical protein
MPATFVAPQVTATSVPAIATATLIAHIPRQAMSISTIAVATEVLPTPVSTVQSSPLGRFSRLPLWVMGAIALQVGVLGLASLEFFRRKRGK